MVLVFNFYFPLSHLALIIINSNQRNKNQTSLKKKKIKPQNHNIHEHLRCDTLSSWWSCFETITRRQHLILIYTQSIWKDKSRDNAVLLNENLAVSNIFEPLNNFQSVIKEFNCIQPWAWFIAYNSLEDELLRYISVYRHIGIFPY